MVQIQERRRRQRITVALPIKIAYNKEKVITATKNISVLGAYLELDKEIPLGTPLDITIRIPKIWQAKARQSEQIRCQGTSFRSQALISGGLQNKYGVGIFFRTFQEKGEKNLSRYIDYILKQEKKMGQIIMRQRKSKLSAHLLRKGGV